MCSELLVADSSIVANLRYTEVSRCFFKFKVGVRYFVVLRRFFMYFVGITRTIYDIPVYKHKYRYVGPLVSTIEKPDLDQVLSGKRPRSR